jgi:serine-type D-Ala-D-Ala carboxypeptidase (penicillin-binding protein 5/6)
VTVRPRPQAPVRVRLPSLALILAGCVLTALAAACALRPASAGAAAPRPPALTVSAAGLLDADTGQLLYGVNPQRQVAIASTTKLMTALITLQHAPLGAVFTEPNWYPAAADSQIGLVPGERMTVHDLLLALLLPSADDAAEDLATGVGQGSVARFVGMMNAEARTLGLTHTHFTTPIGLDTPGNYSTAADLLKLARFDLATRPFFRRAVALPRAVLHSGNRTRVIINRNDLVGRVPWIDGVKTGHTNQAGYVLVASAHRNGMNLISVVLGTPSISERDSTTLALLGYGFSAFHPVTPVRAGQVVAHLPVRDQSKLRAVVVAASGFSSVFARATPVGTRVVLPRRLAGPLPKGHRVGTLLVRSGGRTVARVALVLGRALPKPPQAAVSLATLALPITLLVAFVLVVVARTATGFGRRRTGGSAARAPRRR